MQLANTLEIEIVATLLTVDRLTVQRLAATHLPWLESDAVFLASVQSSLEAELSSSLVQRIQTQDKVLPRAFLAGATEVLEAALRRFGMAVKVRPWLQLEEHTSGVGESLLRKFPQAQAETLPSLLGDERIVWRPYDQALDEHARHLRVADLELSSEPIPVALDRAPMLNLAGPKTFRLARVALFLAGREIASRDCPVVIEPAGPAVELPEVPVASYGPLRAVRGEVELVLWVGSGRRLDGLKVKVALPDLSAAPYALFVDLGSTTTKLLRVTLRSGLAQPPVQGWSAELRDRLAEAARMEESDETLFMPLPEDTPVFLSNRGLEAFDKAGLDSGPPERLAEWLAGAIRGLAVFVAENAGVALSHVFWSFPQTSDRDFDFINATVNRLAGHLVLAGIQIVPEHDCLRRRFGKVLQYLAARAKRRQQEQRDAEVANKETRELYQSDVAAYTKQRADYDSRWISWLWTLRPVRPDENEYPETIVPELEDWYKSFLVLDADPNLEEVLIIDAGGFSLDVFARVGHGSTAQVFPTSFRTGGAQITDGVREYLAGRQGWKVEDVTLVEAERRKREACLDDKEGLSARCRELTAEVYQADLRRLAEWAKPYVEGRAVPVIFTGGAMANVHLRALLLEEFKTQGITPVYTHSVELYGLLTERLSKRERARFQIFCAVSCAFSSKEQPRLNYDIVGGLIEVAKQGEENHAA